MAPRILASGDTALVVEFGATVDRQLSALVLNLDRRLAALAFDGIIETVPTLRSLMVHYDPCVTSHTRLAEAITPLLAGLDDTEPNGRRWRLPVCYDATLAPDLDDVGRVTGLGASEVARLHASAAHRVYMIGFVPGQPYMGGLPEPLHLPRRQTPRTAVPPGSLAIATSMTTVYPVQTPGGWHIIGRTPVPMFDAGRPELPVLLAPADEITIVPIDAAEFERLSRAVAAGEWGLSPESDRA